MSFLVALLVCLVTVGLWQAVMLTWFPRTRQYGLNMACFLGKRVFYISCVINILISAALLAIFPYFTSVMMTGYTVFMLYQVNKQERLLRRPRIKFELLA